MKIDLMDRSKYFRTMMILIKRDLRISFHKKDYFLRRGRVLQFGTDFCGKTIQDMLKNPHIDEKPPVFSNINIAKIYLKNGIQVAFADKNLHQKEYNWIQKVAQANGISDQWLFNPLFDFLNAPQKKKSNTLEIEKNYQTHQEIMKSDRKKHTEH